MSRESSTGNEAMDEIIKDYDNQIKILKDRLGVTLADLHIANDNYITLEHELDEVKKLVKDTDDFTYTAFAIIKKLKEILKMNKQ